MRIFTAVLAVLTLGVVFAVGVMLLVPARVAVEEPTPSASRSGVAAPTRSATHTATPRPTQKPGPTPRSTPAPTTSGVATPAPTPAPTPRPVTGSGDTLLITVAGDEYDEANVPSNGMIVDLGGGAIRLETTREYSDPLTVSWRIPDGSIPAGARIGSIDAAVCGSGGGDFYEVYGPLGSDPFEYEVTPPASDGCWHFSDGEDDSTVLGITFLASWLEVDRIEYRVTLER